MELPPHRRSLLPTWSSPFRDLPSKGLHGVFLHPVFQTFPGQTGIRLFQLILLWPHQCPEHH